MTLRPSRATALQVDEHAALLGQILDELRLIRQALVRRSRPRDEDDVRVFHAMAENKDVRSTRFSAAEVIRHALVAKALREALAAADCESPRSLGRLFRRIEGREIDGLMLVRVGEDRQGLVWVLRVCVTTPDEAR